MIAVRVNQRDIPSKNRVGKSSYGRKVERHVIIYDTAAGHLEGMCASPVYDVLIRRLVAGLTKWMVLCSHLTIREKRSDIAIVHLSEDKALRQNIVPQTNSVNKFLD